MEADNPQHTKEAALKIFQRAFKGDGSFTITKHCKERMRERDVDINDLKSLSLCGRIYDPPEPHIKSGCLIYKMEHPDRKLKVCFAIATTSHQEVVRLVTVER